MIRHGYRVIKGQLMVQISAHEMRAPRILGPGGPWSGNILLRKMVDFRHT